MIFHTEENHTEHVVEDELVVVSHVAREVHLKHQGRLEDEDELPLRELAQPVVGGIRELLGARVEAHASQGHDQREEALGG